MRKSLEANTHPEYDLEKDRLDDTIQAIDSYLNRQANQKPSGGDDWAGMVLEANRSKLSQEYAERRPDPYFARIDYSQDGQAGERLYFGYRGLNLGPSEVIEWRAPLGRLISAAAAERLTIPVPGGSLSGRIFLRRRFKISSAALTDISDEFDLRSEENNDASTQIVANDRYLIDELYSRGDPRLKDIVKTIQKQQDDILRAPADRVLIINGVAGSGKTSIAIHRLAYLLFPDNQTNIKAGACILFCPNRIFLGYIRDLLPNLGEKDIRQTTFDDWAMQRLGVLKVDQKYRLIEPLPNDAPNPIISPQITNQIGKRLRLCGQLKIATLLQRYVKARLAQIKPPAEAWRYDDLGEIHLTLTLTPAVFADILETQRQKKIPFDVIREMTFKALNRQLEMGYDQAVWDRIAEHRSAGRHKQAQALQQNAFVVKQSRLSILGQAGTRLKNDFDAWWKEIDLIEDYYALLGNLKQEQLLTDGLFDCSEIEAFAALRRPAGTILIPDIPALYTFFRLIYREFQESYDHIVVDEAQDFSPLQFSILRACSNNGSLTITGDLAQRIDSGQGLSAWNDLKPVFSGDNVVIENIQQSYRSSQEIVALANHILVKIRGDKAILARPLGRTGGTPLVIVTGHPSQMFAALVEEVDRLRNEYRHVAILVKSQTQCPEVVAFLTGHHIPAATLNASGLIDLNQPTGVVVLPLRDAKGIEFEAVIIFNAGRTEYDLDNEVDGRLLYVAITRALHRLSIIASSPLTGYLEDAGKLVKFQQGSECQSNSIW